MDTATFPDDDNVVALTRAWVAEAVIGLNLCPFAKAVYVKDQVRYVVSHADDEAGLAQQLLDELQHLQAADPELLDTTLLIHPRVLQDFYDYNNFLDVADQVLEDAELDGVIQIASFHPQYQFADALPDDIDNYTNRSPFPVLHLLRESSIDRAVAAFPEASAIFERNIATMRDLGLNGWNRLAFVVSKKQHQL
ncbi:MULTISPECIES: DUF1415 domain-containing protein [unclassified Herbaspirillum]|uniref:DUF1415 domain-containing protein n=1 Tax=unclassified Herbaspirillum TaxID=2624150 RepID=UPI000E2ED48D|nr:MULTISPECIES: DUF1415 domain-containing protein [unclassified Herbaspirillum]RFB69609.1 DUF1415 domain-containing protein [Herbaspirillum sp. 3R-3a1]TFI07334.1 DUF1415 domain-containing protein [Herbaspirillum sp. 3R11]TFI12109.1 DUF1415 domain-containing protein [Herbaspirillum sp. 3R-11]TFI29825.1 DUF1415 domain-containing protein [Herbaspirillum sp. 3C11]